jgi:hypothetical protein
MNPRTPLEEPLAVDAFIRLATVDPERKFSLLLGAGASINLWYALRAEMHLGVEARDLHHS